VTVNVSTTNVTCFNIGCTQVTNQHEVRIDPAPAIKIDTNPPKTYQPSVTETLNGEKDNNKKQFYGNMFTAREKEFSNKLNYTQKIGGIHHSR
jgi:hypothetical protein